MSEAKAPRRYKVIATGEFTQMTPAHQRYVTKTGEGSSLRVAATDAIDKVFREDRVKKLRAKLPVKFTLQEGGDV